jgi:Cd2+/Zn2+-exporting ATPase
MAESQIKTYTIEGLSCSDCAARIQGAVGQMENIQECTVDPLAGTITVHLSTLEIPLAEIEQIVDKTGHRLLVEEGARSQGAQEQASPSIETEEPASPARAVAGFVRFVLSRRETTLTAVAALLTLLGLGLAWANLYLGQRALEIAGLVFFAAAILVGGLPLARFAFQELWYSKRVGINVLMVIAVSGAMLIGEWAEGAIVVVLFSLGEALEGYATERARRTLTGLLSLAPPTALKLLADGTTTEVPVEQLALGDRVRVRAGDRVSVDGTVRAGSSAVDQSPITGESVPVAKGVGDPVYAGTINASGTLEVEVTRRAEDNTLSRMIHLVQQAQAERAPVQRFIDRFARVYTPAVAILAALVAALPPLLFGQPFWGDTGWLMRALQMLVIACPCALVISTPVSVVSALTNAASNGVLVKGGRSLDALSRVRVFAFDKTGTLTEGRPVVTDVIDVCTCGACEESCGLFHASALEAQSAHPLARALVEAAELQQIAVPLAENVIELPGRGIEGTVNGAHVTVASHAHFDEQIEHPPDVCELANQLSAQGKTPILVRHDDEVCALFGIADVSRANSKNVLQALRQEAAIRSAMLTGDHPSVAAEIGRQIGIDEVRAGLLPEDKMTAVAQLRNEYGMIAMVGDGINDAPALARADVGIAMGGAGTDQAMETADVVLMADDLSQLPFLVHLSRRTKATITANVVFALATKAAILSLAAAGLATLWMAIAADVGTSLAVILNGMRMRNVRARS